MKNISKNFIPYREFFKEQMKNLEVRKAYEELDFEYEVKNLILKKN